MADELPEHLVDLQRRAHAAWHEVEAHRKSVDAARRRAAEESDAARREAGERPPGLAVWQRPVLREWTAAENAEHARLMQAAADAQEAVRAAFAGAGLDGGHDVTQGLHQAARQG